MRLTCGRTGRRVVFFESRAVIMIANLLDRLRALRRPGTTTARLGACDETIDEMGVYLSGEMAGSCRERFVNHIRNCPECHDKLLALELSVKLFPIDERAEAAVPAGGRVGAPVVLERAAARGAAAFMR